MKYKNYNDYELLYLLKWHSEEALSILLKKYESLIKVKLKKFNVDKMKYNDYLQEIYMVVYKGISNFDEENGKSLCRYLELLIERRLLRLLKYEYRNNNTFVLLEDVIQFPKHEDTLQEMVYEKRLREINETKLDDFKKAILNEVLLEGNSIKEFSHNHNTTVKEVYNHIYLLRCKLKGKP